MGRKRLDGPDVPRNARAAYRGQRWAAGDRGIEWCFEFATWWEVWKASGKWELRGKAAGCYCMARNGDCGPYAPWNVQIVPSGQNGSDAFKSVPYLSRRGRVIKGKTGVGGGKGVYRRSDRRRRSYTAVFRGKYLGGFFTEGEARAAYVRAANAFLESINHAERVEA